jgi:hypothetical protein
MSVRVCVQWFVEMTIDVTNAAVNASAGYR